jgi:hypothetical protein
MGHRVLWQISMVARCAISAEQNAEQQVNLLAAASHIYGNAKRLMAFQLTITVPAALVSSILMAWKPDLRIWLTCYSISVALLDTLFLSRLLNQLKRKGALIQQMFDCALFGLPWRPLRCGRKVESEYILDAARCQLAKMPVQSQLLNWYPTVVDQIPLAWARLICQRASFWWDLNQRARVRAWLIFFLVVLSLAIFGIALIRGDTVQQMILTVYVPLAPAVISLLREIFAQSDAIKADQRGLDAVEALWGQSLLRPPDDSETSQQSLLIQDALFDGRCRSPLIFDWAYSILRQKKEDQMMHRAAELVQEAKSKLNQ